MFSWVTSLTKKDPKEVVRKCRAEIRAQKRDIDRNISHLTVEQRKAERSIREAAKRNDIQSARVRLGYWQFRLYSVCCSLKCNIVIKTNILWLFGTKKLQFLAKELLRSRKAVAKLAENKATLSALDLQMAEARRNIKLAETVKSSAKMIESMNKLMKVPKLHDSMKNMAKEMAYAGLISETINEGIEAAVDDEDYEEAADEAVNKVLLELTGETMTAAAAVPMSRVPGQRVVEKDEVMTDEELMKLLHG